MARIAVTDQLILSATPRGIRWLRSRPVVSLARIAGAHAWLVETGHWPSDQVIDVPAQGFQFRFSEGWRDLLASGTGRSPDLDLALAIDAFRTGLRREIQLEFWSTSVQSAFAVIGAGGAVIARSGSETATMQLNYGSIAKIEPLTVALEAFGPEGVKALSLPPARCVRWFWSASRENFGKFCPTDVTPPDGSMSLDRAVARSINTSTARHVALLPYRLWLERPEYFARVIEKTTAAEKSRLDSEADRAISANMLTALGLSMRPEDISGELAYSALEVSWFRFLKERRAEAGLPVDRLPDDPTQIVGNSSRATLEEIGAYVHQRFFVEDGSCELSDTGAMLANERRLGTLRWLAAHKPKLVFAGKTGTSPHDDAVVAVVAVCVDGRPVVLAAGARPVQGKLPQGFHGSVLLRGVLDYLKALESLERSVSGPALPVWSAPEGATFAVTGEVGERG